MLQASQGIELKPTQEQPIADARIETFDYNLQRMISAVESIENRCHYLLNQRQTQPASNMKAEVPLETDFIAKLDIRMKCFADLNDRLEVVNHHLALIVG